MKQFIHTHKKKILIVGAMLIFLGGLWAYLDGGTAGTVHEIVLTRDGYVPAEITIERGDTVRFTAGYDTMHWPASDEHPIHAEYPAFDPLRPMAADENWEFTFKETGTYGLHDHLHSLHRGVIYVVE